MSEIAEELDQRLRELDPGMAHQLEKVVRDLIHLTRKPIGKKDALGYPEGYFEATAGSFAGEILERPEDLPPDRREEW